MASDRDHFMGPVVILMTATIRAPSRSDPEVALRLEEYCRALHFWLRYPDPRISGVVLCDNSGHSLERLRDVVAASGSGRRAEVMSGPNNEMPAGMHYGYAEMAIIDYAVARSRLLRESIFFAKATGRLLFPGFGRLLNRLPNDFEFAIDYYRAPRRLGGQYRARTQLMLFKTECFKNTFTCTQAVMRSQGISHIEEAIPAVAKPGTTGDGAGRIYRWPIECPPSGVGGDGQRYDGFRYRTKVCIRGAMRTCMPWLWK